ncbi:MAG: hypothetical protein IRZ18_03700 [Clostridia bacterium]|nr:hypothetical protein [Clostridia bacterium]
MAQEETKKPRCQRCGVELTPENRSQSSGYCDACQALVEGEIRRLHQDKES